MHFYIFFSYIYIYINYSLKESIENLKNIGINKTRGLFKVKGN